jgi:adenine specific DNA methylase Mod
MSHYLKVLLERDFGADRFVNEIAWQRSSGKRALRS